MIEGGAVDWANHANDRGRAQRRAGDQGSGAKQRFPEGGRRGAAQWAVQPGREQQ